MVVFFIIICVAFLIGGMYTEYHRQKHMSPAQQRQRQREHFQVATGLFAGLFIGTTAAITTVIKKSGD